MYINAKNADLLCDIYKNYMRMLITNSHFNNELYFLPIDNESFVQYIQQYKNLDIDCNMNTIFTDIHYYAPINSVNHGKLFKELQKEYFRYHIYLYDDTFLKSGITSIFVTQKLVLRHDNIIYHNLNILPFTIKNSEDPIDNCIIM